jgi:stage II sporulation protein D
LSRAFSGIRTALALAVVTVLLGCAVRTVSAPPIVAPTPAPTATPAAPPPPAPAAAPAVEAPERSDTRPPVVRVLLSASAEPTFPQPGRRYACLGGDVVSIVRGPLLARVVAGRAAIQIGAFAQEPNARGALVRLNATGFDGRVETGDGSPRRVIALGREGETVEALAGRLRAAGFVDQKVLSAASGGSVVLTGEGAAGFSAPLVRLVPIDPDAVLIGGKAVRGEFELRPGTAGVLVINVINLEQYLRGVVPAEMGPHAFPSIEALKAQAVAARTYAVAHLGDHAPDGYDLCDSPACQAYEGVGAEQPLTDRAVAETAGEIATYQGRPIDAMYHSTCAGHTEDAAALFPNRAEPYLKGVPCRGEAAIEVGGRTTRGPWLGPLERLTLIGQVLATALGRPPDARSLAARLTGRQVGAGRGALVEAFALEGTAPALHIDAGAGDDETDELLRTFRLPLPPPHRSSASASWEIALVVRLAQLAGEVTTDSGRLVPGPSGVRLLADGSATPHDLTGHETVLVQRGERWRRGSASVMAGSPATLWCAAGVCPLVEVDPMDSADAGSAWTWWVRELTLADIGRRLGLAGVRDVIVLRRGVSGRALAVKVVTANGAREFAGIPFRRALALPDTLFLVVRSGGDARPALRFLGRGWGHGVGMCQNGAYGLARGGESYVQILKTYYTGIEIGTWEGGKR